MPLLSRTPLNATDSPGVSDPLPYVESTILVKLGERRSWREVLEHYEHHV